MPPRDQSDLIEKIHALKEETNTIILAHLYQVLPVQDTGDFVGDSLGLSRKAAHVRDANNIIFAAVDFMAEVAKLLNPAKNVLLPDPSATCPMANRLLASTVKKYKEEYPGIPVVLYVNTLAEAKAEADVICTSANSIEICKKIAKEKGVNKLIVGPDKNLARFISTQTDLDLIVMPEDGCCNVHDHFTIEDVNLQLQQHPDSIVIVHPECRPEVQDAASFVGSTSQMLAHVSKSSESEFIIGTERELSMKLQRDHPDRKFHPLGATGGICPNMKKTTLPLVVEVLEKIKDGRFDDHLVNVPDHVGSRAKRAIDRMFALMEKGEKSG